MHPFAVRHIWRDFLRRAGALLAEVKAWLSEQERAALDFMSWL